MRIVQVVVVIDDNNNNNDDDDINNDNNDYSRQLHYPEAKTISSPAIKHQQSLRLRRKLIVSSPCLSADGGIPSTATERRRRLLLFLLLLLDG